MSPWLLLCPVLGLARQWTSNGALQFLADYRRAFPDVEAPTLQMLQTFATAPAEQPIQQFKDTLPPGPYNESCVGCRLDGGTLVCASCTGGSGAPTSLSLSSCASPVSVANRGGFLQCTWADAPPPRVGALIPNGSYTDADQGCRVLEQTTFIAPQMLPSDAPLATHSGVRDAAACCALCTQANANATLCRAWTLSGGNSGEATCTLVRSSNTAYPNASAVSGYPLKADPASYCTQLHAHTFSKGGVYDRTMKPDVACRSLAPSPYNTTGAFPRGWWDRGQPSFNSSVRRHRGTAYLFFPQADGRCECRPSPPAGNTTCAAAPLSEADINTHIAGRPWAVFVHGGRFVYLDAIQV